MEDFVHIDPNLDLTNSDDIKKEIQRLTRLSSLHRNADQALKILLNSVYGVMGYPYFVDYMRDVAKSVTASAVGLIKLTEKIINDFFSQEWESSIENDDDISFNNPIDSDVVLYMDTDSIFLDMQTIYDSTITDMNMLDFSMKVWNYHIYPYYLDKSREYFAAMGAGDIDIGEPRLELEEFCYKILWATKKRYVKVSQWYKKQTYEFMDKFSVKGLEIIKYVYSKFSRDSMLDMVKLIINNASHEKILSKAKSIKDMYKLHADDLNYYSISKTERITTYTKNVIQDDQHGVKVNSGTPIQVKASARYNHMIKKHNLLNSYPLITNGDKICWYYDINDQPFGFPLNGDFPKEIAPKINLSSMYNKTFLDPINTILLSIGKDKVNKNFVYIPKIF